jgi:DNA-binding winged helix-turn-helix (wHTH) protein
MTSGELRRANRTVHLAAQPAKALIALVDQAPRLVTREELKAAVWGPETFVDFEQGLNFCIKQIPRRVGRRRG